MEAETHDDTEPEERVEFSATVAAKITFASHQNDVPLIADLSISNTTDDTVENAVLELVTEPEIVAPRRWMLDRISANSMLRIKDRRISLPGAMLSKLTEAVRGEAVLTLRKGDETLDEKRFPLTALARNEWGGANSMPELLAAFVAPNDPAVERILKAASDTLGRAGKNTAIDGYQSKSRQRVYELASAIWSAVASHRLTYCEPPASFEREGQKIRMPAHVWESGLATCLDVAVLFAAALEQAGLNAILAFTKGHALCGLWLQPQNLQSVTTDDAADLRKHIDLKELILFETTMVSGAQPAKFSQAVAAGKRQAAEEVESEFVYALDLKRARAQQISPLATEVRPPNASPETNMVAVEGLDAAPELPSFDIGVSDVPPPDTPETRLDHWKRQLLDLTKRNRLLNLKPSKTAIRIHCSDPALLEDKLAADETIKIVPRMVIGEGRDEAIHAVRTGEDLRVKFAADALERNEVVADLDRNDLDTGLVQLYRKARSDIQEGGANTLYLALGFLRWKQSADEQRSYRAPLILKPVKLERRSVVSGVKLLTHEDDPVFNMTLLELLRQEFDLRIPELDGELPMDDSGVDVPQIWNIMRKAVRTMPGFEVTEEVVLSTFSFAKYLMWKDLSDRTEALKESPFVKHLIDHPREAYGDSASIMRTDEVDKRIDPGELFMPMPADSSQIVAVHASTQGGDFVLEGPPGTGKSQTIANIIAHNLANKRRVLFVSEKMAALDVVYERLKEVQLDDFCLELHSNKANKKQVIDQLGRAWAARTVKSADEWAKQAGQVKKLRDDLNDLVGALHTPGPTGVTPRAAIARAVAYDDVHRLRLDWEGGLDADPVKSRENWADLLDLADRLASAFADITPSDREALGWIETEEWSMAWQGKIVAEAAKLGETAMVLDEVANAFLSQLGLECVAVTVDAVRALADMASALPIAADQDLGFALEPDARRHFSALEQGLDAIDVYTANKRKLSTPYTDEAIKSAPLAEWQAQWSKAAAGSPLLGPVRRWMLSRTAAKDCGLDKRPDLGADLVVLKQLESNLAQISGVGTALPDHFGWHGLNQPVDVTRARLEAGRQLNRAMLALSDAPEGLAAARQALRIRLVEGRELLSDGAPIRKIGEDLFTVWSKYEAATERFLGKAGASSLRGAGTVAGVAEQAHAIVDLQPRLNPWCRLNRVRREAEGRQLGALVSALETGVVEPAEAREALTTAYYTWLASRFIDDREELRTFSAREHGGKIERFRRLDRQLSEMASGYARAVLSGDIPTPDSEERDPGYGILKRQMQRQRGHLPVRELVNQMGGALTQLTPCLMMSPLSVAQYLSAGDQLFDLVVFDEASQITVWDAIGGIARGKNAIIVGDPKQMPPTNFFNKAAGDSDSDGDGDSAGGGGDLESILDEAMAASVKHHRLTGHYRSKHESLIAFSNHRYYEGELVTYPSCETRASAVTFKKVEGEYLKGRGRTNPPEAQAVVSEIVRRLKDPELSELSIGVVAMNAEQQRLIENLLDDERRADPELEVFFGDGAREPVFVKNLETVQGDARDVILLSIGYGPDTPGAKTMSMNFGPLNRQGGERRLNVAITRATTEVVVFASFTPDMIDLTRTSARALADLKHYLEFAERGPEALGEAVTSIGGYDAYDSEFERRVAELLRAKGWDVRTQVGVSKFRIDLGVVHPDLPGVFLAGIECDGATYHSSPTARDRDRVRAAILENLKWKLVRIWSTDFFRDPAGTLDQVHERLQMLLEADREEREAASTENVAIDVEGDAPCDSIDLDSGTANTQAEGTADLKNGDDEPLCADLTGEGSSMAESAEPELIRAASIETAPAPDIPLDPDHFYEPGYRTTVRKLAIALIDEVGPIRFKHLSEIIARRHGFRRTGKQIKSQVWAAVKTARGYTVERDGQKLFWPDGVEPVEFIGYRGLKVGGIERTWRDIPSAELLGLAREVTAGSGASVEAMAEALGLKRISAGTRQELEEVLEETRRSKKG